MYRRNLLFFNIFSPRDHYVSSEANICLPSGCDGCWLPDREKSCRNGKINETRKNCRIWSQWKEKRENTSKFGVHSLPSYITYILWLSSIAVRC